jgi:hypothetical protein
MFYDLNVPYSPGDHEISATLSFLAERTSLFFLIFFSHAQCTRLNGWFNRPEKEHMKS